jgi:hypothetical protein
MAYSLSDKIEWTVYFIDEFAEKFGLTLKEAYHYLSIHQGIKFIDECYDYIHTQSFEDAIEDAATICRQDGGKLK